MPQAWPRPTRRQSPHVTHHGDEQHRRHVDPREQRGGRRPGDAERGETEAPVDQDPIGAGVHQVGAHQCEHHRRHPVHPLQIPAERCVEDEEGRAPERDPEEGLDQLPDVGMEAHGRNREQQRNADEEEQRREHQREHDAASQPGQALVQPPGAVRLRHERVEAEQQAHGEHGVARSASALPIPTAPIAAGPSGPTMIVSTTPMHIQPSSARITGPATRNMGLSSLPIKKD